MYHFSLYAIWRQWFKQWTLETHLGEKVKNPFEKVPDCLIKLTRPLTGVAPKVLNFLWSFGVLLLQTFSQCKIDLAEIWAGFALTLDSETIHFNKKKSIWSLLAAECWVMLKAQNWFAVAAVFALFCLILHFWWLSSCDRAKVCCIFWPSLLNW